MTAKYPFAETSCILHVKAAFIIEQSIATLLWSHVGKIQCICAGEETLFFSGLYSNYK
jgi:hypothetical protein